MQQVRWDTLARALKYVHAHSQNTPCVVYLKAIWTRNARKKVSRRVRVEKSECSKSIYK